MPILRIAEITIDTVRSHPDCLFVVDSIEHELLAEQNTVGLDSDTTGAVLVALKEHLAEGGTVFVHANAKAILEALAPTS